MRWNALKWTPKSVIERTIGFVMLVVAALGPLLFNDYWTHQILIETFLFGITAASLIFLFAYAAWSRSRRRPCSESRA